MTFTYDLSLEDDDLRISKVRLAIGDTSDVRGEGVKPDGSFFQDEEILSWLSDEGNDVFRATAAACEALSRIWAPAANFQNGPRREELATVSINWSREAARLRKTYGTTTTRQKNVSAGTIKVDGYSSDVGSDVVDNGGSDYEPRFRYVRPG